VSLQDGSYLVDPYDTKDYRLDFKILFYRLFGVDLYHKFNFDGAIRSHADFVKHLKLTKENLENDPETSGKADKESIPLRELSEKYGGSELIDWKGKVTRHTKETDLNGFETDGVRDRALKMVEEIRQVSPEFHLLVKQEWVQFQNERFSREGKFTEQFPLGLKYPWRTPAQAAEIGAMNSRFKLTDDKSGKLSLRDGELSFAALDYIVKGKDIELTKDNEALAEAYESLRFAAVYDIQLFIHVKIDEFVKRIVKRLSEKSVEQDSSMSNVWAVNVWRVMQEAFGDSSTIDSYVVDPASIERSPLTETSGDKDRGFRFGPTFWYTSRSKEALFPENLSSGQMEVDEVGGKPIRQNQFLFHVFSQVVTLVMSNHVYLDRKIPALTQQQLQDEIQKAAAEAKKMAQQGVQVAGNLNLTKPTVVSDGTSGAFTAPSSPRNSLCGSSSPKNPMHGYDGSFNGMTLRSHDHQTHAAPRKVHKMPGINAKKTIAKKNDTKITIAKKTIAKKKTPTGSVPNSGHRRSKRLRMKQGKAEASSSV
jgi:hypothetical protein